MNVSINSSMQSLINCHDKIYEKGFLFLQKTLGNVKLCVFFLKREHDIKIVQDDRYKNSSS